MVARHACPGAPVRRLAVAVCVAVLTALALMGTGSAGINRCSGGTTQPFLPWGDGAYYVSVPNGDFESGKAGWTLQGDAAIVSGNESFDVGGATDAFSLSLPADSTARTTSTCIGTESPTMRFFARNTGAKSSTLRVDAIYQDSHGLTWSATVGDFQAGADWQPTEILPISADVSGQTFVSFQFTPEGNGDWQIDDVYVDPYVGT